MGIVGLEMKIKTENEHETFMFCYYKSKLFFKNGSSCVTQVVFAQAVLPAVPVAWLRAPGSLGGTGWQTCARCSVLSRGTPAEHRHHGSTAASMQRSSVEKILGRTQWYEQHPWSGGEWKEKYWSVSAHSTGCLIQQMSLIHLDFLILLSAHAQSCLTYA